MDIRRVILYMALALISLSLWNAWQIDYPTKPAPTDSAITNQQNSEPLLPQMAPSTAVATSITPANDVKTSNAPIIHVKTDVLDIGIDLQQGDIVSSQLLAYPQSIEEKNKPFLLLQNQPNERYIASSNLFVASGQNIQALNFNFTSPQQQYELDPNQKQLVVTLNGKNGDGLDVKKEFTFTKGSYVIDVEYKIVNQGNGEWTGYMNTQLIRSSPKEDKSSVFHVGSYTGASYSEPGKHRYQKVSFSDMNKTNLDVDSKGGWVAMQQHYFLSAWIPDVNSTNKFYTRAVNNDYTIGAVSQPITLQPSQEKTLGSKLYVGPEITSTLKGIAPSLDLTVDYGILWFLSSLLFSLMKIINNVVGNWGWSIVLVTVLIKLAFYRLSAASYKSMAGMRKLQPKLQALRERYGDDKAKISQATMELYKQEKVNPLGGCLPILIQIPVFIALYWVLLESVELRQAPFILWIKDLSDADPYHVLPLIMGATMLIQQKLNPAPPDPMQAKVMMFLPVLFTGLFWSFPAGLVLYWIVNNTLSILQQWYITRKFSDEKPAKKLAVVK
ncbi:membrane protein insertase YidC [Legionella longbeachae]|uniref:Membrane protein insertase YidC n=1 Tax=Legionella longbeachae serogroup 1 (strain NSW150) TaxID=661367 RepID=D3HN62_LEGLN|nr:membrane protein insertase YidC [Legionella longbeachae]VEE04428.1 cytoplasmic insertase into membrane protein, Sec system [Legionella oakridgensis]HBD7397180.1 membrane protein insertase YidC [Legionella pneumophila]ARB92753.1 membrane protein insertase YidC [Legionella longbeachae]ARM34082.1 membrane protein insertase YidC [Legionella longbeachae]EEZ96687.1 inner membrane protein OxaA [Legionella longbeachae D-4968]